jgi:hypothetical protein
VREQPWYLLTALLSRVGLEVSPQSFVRSADPAQDVGVMRWMEVRVPVRWNAPSRIEVM